jgi:hypothetical protein
VREFARTFGVHHATISRLGEITPAERTDQELADWINKELQAASFLTDLLPGSNNSQQA